MYNWSVDEKELKKYPDKYAIWKLEQMVNFGLGEEKLNEADIKKYLPLLDIDEPTRKYLEFLLWPKKSKF